jgi:predicted negative regulator of RcsB-dependent stress response
MADTSPSNAAEGAFESHCAHAADLVAQGRFDEAVEAFRSALALRADLVTQLNLGLVLQAQGRLDEAVACYRAATAAAPNLAETQIRLGAVLSQAGDMPAALTAFRRASELDGGDPRAQVHLGHALRMVGDLAGAEAAWRSALTLAPEHVEARAHLSLLLPGIGKAAEAAILLDYQRLLATRRLDWPEGWPSLKAFNDDLADAILHHSTLVRDPAHAATKGGSQTREILDGGRPSLRTLKDFIDRSVAHYLGGLADDPAGGDGAPRRCARSLNAWAVILRSGGYQRAHFHPTAFVSGVYHVRVPQTVGATAGDEAGFLRFGPPADDAATTALSRSVRPEEGLVVLFPSYFWHRTVPFDSDDERISVAFDVIA